MTPLHSSTRTRGRACRALLAFTIVFSTASLVPMATADAQRHVSRGHRVRKYRHPSPPAPPMQVVDPFIEPGRFRVANLRLNGQSHEVVVTPGERIQAELDLRQHCPGCGTAINQIIVGFAGAAEAQACVWNGGARSRGWQHAPFTLVAPSEPGDYAIRVRYAQAYGCAQGALGWWRVDRPSGPGPESTIGIVHVVARPERSPRSPSPASRGSLIENGSFEAPAIAVGNWRSFPAIPGWRLSGGSSIEVQNRVAGSPHDGNQFVELDSESSSAIYQDVRTAPGATYELRLAFSPRPGTGAADNRLSVRFDGREVGVVEGNGRGRSDTDWRYVTFRVVASSYVTRLELVDIGRSNSLGTYIDDVSLTRVRHRRR